MPHKKQVDQNPFAKNTNPILAMETDKLAIIKIHLESNLSVRPTYIGVSNRYPIK